MFQEATALLASSQHAAKSAKWLQSFQAMCLYTALNTIVRISVFLADVAAIKLCSPEKLLSNHREVAAK